MSQFKDNDCLLTTQKHCPCIEFVVSDRDRQGFHSSQLLHYQLGANDGDGQDASSEKLTIAFATADVTLTGWRLDRLAEKLRDGELLAVRTLPTRYAQFDQTKCAVASIAMEPIERTEPQDSLHQQ